MSTTGDVKRGGTAQFFSLSREFSNRMTYDEPHGKLTCHNIQFHLVEQTRLCWLQTYEKYGCLMFDIFKAIINPLSHIFISAEQYFKQDTYFHQYN